MKKRILIGLFMICSVLFPSFITQAATITFSCDTATSLTKTIFIEAASNVTINWGNNETKTYDVPDINDEYRTIEINHTYINTGEYPVSLTAEGITLLEMAENDIFKIDLSEAVQLKELKISDNKLTELELSNNTAIDKLNCSGNYLTKLDVSGKNISVLECAGNRISSFYIPNTITELYASNNDIVGLNGLNDFDLSEFSNLTILECADNQISNLILDGCNLLKKIEMSNNLVSNISFNSNNALEELYCASNELTNLELSNKPLLHTLDCSGNNIVTANLVGCANLKTLYIHNTKLTNLDLNNINFNIVTVDNTTELLNNSSIITIKAEIIGNGGFYVTDEKIIVFSSVPKSLIINGVNQGNVEETLDISAFVGEYNVSISFEEEDEAYVIVNNPQVLEGMIPLKHNGTNWVIVDYEDPTWYNYDKEKMQWANIMLRDDAKYLDSDGITLIDVEKTPFSQLIGREVPENCTGSMYVWIPRYTYNTDGDTVKIHYSEGFEDYIEAGYKLHPAFNYAKYLGGDASLETSYNNLDGANSYFGIWVAKYPAGRSIAQPKYAKDLTEITTASIGQAFSASKLTSTSDVYGVTGVISHMIKNSEWGAVAYFSTAVGNLSDDSTTGNKYGIYNMNSNSEYVSSFIELVGGISNVTVRKNGKSLLPYSIISYDNTEVANENDVDILRLKTVTDDVDSNSEMLNSFFGFGINDVSSNITGTITKNVPTGNNAFFIRGIDGIYSYSEVTGEGNSNIGFRNVLLGERTDEVERTLYTITASTSEFGTISPKGSSVVEAGGKIVYVIKSQPGYEPIEVLVDGVSAIYSDNYNDYGTYATYTFGNINADHEIHVTFDTKALPYEVTVTKNTEEAGEIIGAGTYKNRSKVTLVANGNPGYRFSFWEKISGLDEEIDTSSSEIVFKMPSNNVELKANFERLLKAILVVEDNNVKTQFEKTTGSRVSVKAILPEGYIFDCWEATGIDLGDKKNDQEIEIIMAGVDVYLTAKYNKLYPVVITLGDGTILEIQKPETKKVLIKAPASCNEKSFTGWVVNGLDTELNNETQVDFTMPSNEVNIVVQYN